MTEFNYNIIPALAGHFVCEPVFVGKRISALHEQPIVAWAVVSWGHEDQIYADPQVRANPVIAESTIPDRYFLKHPNGTYELPDDDFDLTLQQAIDLAQSMWGESQ